MNTRAATIVAAMIASLFFSANAFAAPEDAAADNTEQPVEHCLTSPRDYTPPGTRWRYRIEPSSGRRCWFLKDDAEKAAGKAAAPSTAATEEPASTTRRKKQAAPRTLSDARAELSSAPVEQDTKLPAKSAPAPAASAPAVESNPTSTAKSANMLAPGAATRWPDPMSTVNPAANAPAPQAAPAPPPEQSTDARPATAPPSKPQVMPRAVPPMPASEKPLSTPMLITIIAGGLSVLGVMLSLLFAWLAARRARRQPSAPMPPLEMPDQPRRPGDLYRERKRLRAKRSGRRAA